MNAEALEHSKKKILIVDDSDNIRLFVKSILERNGYETILAKNGAEALRLFNSSRDISLILLDVMMPYMDGFEFLRQFPKTFPNSTTKICMMTAKGAAKEVKRAVNLGAHDYIVKLIDRDILISKVETLLEDKKVDEKFSSITTEIDAQVTDLPIEHQIKIIELTEAQAIVKTKLQLKEKSNLTLRIPALDNAFGKEVELCFRVVSEQKSEDPDFLVFKLNILGLDETTQSCLREITIKGLPFGIEPESD